MERGPFSQFISSEDFSHTYNIFAKSLAARYQLVCSIDAAALREAYNLWVESILEIEKTADPFGDSAYRTTLGFLCWALCRKPIVDYAYEHALVSKRSNSFQPLLVEFSTQATAIRICMEEWSKAVEYWEDYDYLLLHSTLDLEVFRFICERIKAEPVGALQISSLLSSGDNRSQW